MNNRKAINTIEEIGFDLEKAQMMVSEIQDSYLDGAPCDLSNPKDREDLSYKLLLEFQRYSVYTSVLMDYMNKVEKGLDRLTKDLDDNRHETDQLGKNIEAAMVDAADLMEAITNGAATGEMIKNNAEVAQEFLDSALYDFTQMRKGVGAGRPERSKSPIDFSGVFEKCGNVEIKKDEIVNIGGIDCKFENRIIIGGDEQNAN